MKANTPNRGAYIRKNRSSFHRVDSLGLALQDDAIYVSRDVILSQKILAFLDKKSSQNGKRF